MILGLRNCLPDVDVLEECDQRACNVIASFGKQASYGLLTRRTAKSVIFTPTSDTDRAWAVFAGRGPLAWPPERPVSGRRSPRCEHLTGNL